MHFYCFALQASRLREMQIAFENAHEGLLKLLVGQRIAEWIERAVGIAKKIGEHVEVLVGARWRGAEAFDERKDMIRCPADNESAENEADGTEGFTSAVL